jgi:two-component system nitrate/nitrite sensor histidine kinase NarQ
LTYRQIKWLILIVPSLTIGIWEFVRHEFHIPYLSMELGNVLAPFIVLGATLAISLPLFRMLEHSQRQLQAARELQSALEERERIARELHDGIAQSLFLLAVKADRLESGDAAAAESIRHIVHRVNDYVRQAIASLRFAPAAQSLPWTEMLHRLFAEARDAGLDVRVDWRLPEAVLSVREKVELYACLREALSNVQKHADAREAFVRSEATTVGGWTCSVADDGRGPDAANAAAAGDGRGRYGLTIVRERAAAMGWRFALEREAERTIFTIRKE